jgi:hypothetical protein
VKRVSIELVTHCWAEHYPLFAGALCHQLSSLVINKPKNADVCITICLTASDRAVVDVIRHFNSLGEPKIKVLPLPLESLGRRSIGRNSAALHTSADIVWFTDVDHFFGPNCLDSLADYFTKWPKDAKMIFPRSIKIHKDWETGDKALRSALKDIRVININKDDFVDKQYHRAIGGVQIVQGDFAREHGYLNGNRKWLKPRQDGLPFNDFKDDVIYRNFAKSFENFLKIERIELEGLYRLRHTETTYQ